MQQLNLPPFDAKIIQEKGKYRIFDVIRKKNIALTPEEWVRQHFIHLLINLKYPTALMAIEKLVVVNNLKQRADIVVYNRDGKPAMIIECKAPGVLLNNETIAQAARYNIKLGVGFLVITNGISTYCVKLAANEHQVMESLPDFDTINSFRPQ